MSDLVLNCVVKNSPILTNSVRYGFPAICSNEAHHKTSFTSLFSYRSKLNQPSVATFCRRMLVSIP